MDSKSCSTKILDLRMQLPNVEVKFKTLSSEVPRSENWATDYNLKG